MASSDIRFELEKGGRAAVRSGNSGGLLFDAASKPDNFAIESKTLQCRG